MYKIEKGSEISKPCKKCNKNKIQLIYVTLTYNGSNQTKRFQTLCLKCFKQENDNSSCYITKKK
jgi:hypothetical protein